MSDYLQINTAKIAQEIIDGEVIIINLDEGYYYSLLNIGTEIWQNIEKGFSQYEIIQEILNRYDGIAEEIKEGVEGLIDELIEEEIILSVSHSFSEKREFSAVNINIQKAETKLKFEKPRLQKYTDMQDLLTLDPIHDVDETGWPNPKQI
ncbi:hypothetical protein GM3708_3494 [Geminocystis sp. NIES-3708]|uniref:PqqD family protein n=1 Tax=Geminocystis sp. NIES-3708 TaxID=1615909 RepID=UPI0005FCD15D|nr:PqqD family protein [Geminocystis sp. NIES-3708]BAQ63088.1 hypothetical protein GM3708_3494 [Geminocystis sp. NIES-3708]